MAQRPKAKKQRVAQSCTDEIAASSAQNASASSRQEKGTNGIEYFVVSVDDYEVLGLSPALLQRYCRCLRE